jgi:photosystem II stability/assembly factor-like uncharacterized protein
VPVLTYGVFESVSELAKQGVHVMEDPQLLGARAAGQVAAAVAANQAAVQVVAGDDQAALVESAMAILQTMRGGANDELVNRMEQMLQSGQQFKVITVNVDAQRAADQVTAEADSKVEVELDDDEFIEETATPQPKQKKKNTRAEIE